jgi:hypothetical protein
MDMNIPVKGQMLSATDFNDQATFVTISFNFVDARSASLNSFRAKQPTQVVTSVLLSWAHLNIDLHKRNSLMMPGVGKNPLQIFPD